MIDEFSLETSRSPFDLKKTLEERLSEKGYKSIWKIWAFGLQARFKSKTTGEIQFYFKTFLSIIPIWYMGVAIQPGEQEQKNKILFFYYIKGLRFLDIFRIAGRWQREFEDFKKALG